MYLPYFCFCPFFLFGILTFAESCLLDWFSIIVSIKILFSCKYNPSGRLNVCCMKSKNIWLRFIALSFWTSMSYLSRFRAILYCLNNSYLLAIIMHGLPISNWFFFLNEGRIHFYYSTFANQYESLTCVKYKKKSLCLQQI